jgi:hypothetical protein
VFIYPTAFPAGLLKFVTSGGSGKVSFDPSLKSTSLNHNCSDAHFLAVCELPPKAAINICSKSRNLDGKTRKAIPCKSKQGDGFFIIGSIGSSEFARPSPYAC